MKKDVESYSDTAHVIDAHVGDQLRKRREKLNLKQLELGKLLGISYQQIQKYEKGENKIPAGRLFQLAQLLGVTTEYFYQDMDLASNSIRQQAYLCTKRTKPLNILLVEDDPTDQMLTRNALEECKLDNNLYVIHDGERALSFLRHEIEEDFPRPDIILLDLNIPKRDGFFVLKELGRDKSLLDIPVIILTNSNDPKHMFQGYQNNICGYINKSFDVNIFNHNIAVVVDYWSSVSILPSMQSH